MLDQDDELITLFVGEGISKDNRDAMISLLEDKFPTIDIESHYGGQPLYYYIISVE